jgi:hypothetical protein
MSEEIRSQTSAQSPAPTQQQTGTTVVGPALPEPTTTNRRLLIILILIAVAAIALIIGAILFLAADPLRTAVIRDMFIILLALVSLVIGALMFVLIWQLQSLISLLRNEIKPMLLNANQTVSAVRGTTVFVSDNLVRPTIGVASFVARVRAMQQAFVGKANSVGRRTRSAARNQQSQSASQS